MRKTFLALALMMSTIMFSQTYNRLWMQVDSAQNRDLPKTEQQVLAQIVAKAEAERNYGQLLRAELQRARSLVSVSPDSMEAAVDRLKVRQQTAADEPLRAIYSAVLGYIYDHNAQLGDDVPALAQQFYDRAVQNPAQLAAVKATDYEPFVIEGADSRLYDHDLLSLIGRETGRFHVLASYYSSTGNRRAALLSAIDDLQLDEPDEMEHLATSAHLQRIDSLLAQYADLEEAGEAAIYRYQYMTRNTDATAAQCWDYIDFALERWGAWPRMNTLRNSRSDLSARMFSAQYQEVMIPQQAQTVHLHGLRGIERLTLRVYRVDAQGDIALNPSNDEDYKKLKPLLRGVAAEAGRTYDEHLPYEQFEDSLVLPPLPVGVYMLEFSTLPATQVERQLYYVSNVRVLAQELPQKKVRYVAVDATTGQPLPGAQLRLSTYGGYRQGDQHTMLTAGRLGEVIHAYTNRRPYRVFATTASDKACPPMYTNGGYAYNGRTQTVKQAAIYTDRNIYRPGQTVHAAAIVYETANGFESQVLPGRSVKALLRDANYQVVAEQQLTTDEFGTCWADFTLPAQGLSGHYTLTIDGHQHGFRVEEYKRPTFQVELPRPQVSYADGDTLSVVGTARSYAGVPVQGARVIYKVERRRAFWWMSYSRYWNHGLVGAAESDDELLSGEAVTDDEGHFTVQVPLHLPRTQHTMFYNFVVTADVTDQAGETHQGSLSLPLGNRATALSCTLAEKVLRDEPAHMVFNLRNAAGSDVEGTVSYRFDAGDWQSVATQANVALPLERLKSGRHTLEATCQGDTLTQEFTVFALDDKRPAAPTDDWFYLSAQQFSADHAQPVTVQVGSSDKDVHIVYALFAGDNIVESGAVDRSDRLINRQFTYKESYGNGLLLTFAWVKNGKTYTHTATIQRPLPRKDLTLRWETFRDRLTPGQQEEWTLTVEGPAVAQESGATSKPVEAQLLATLYDKSLDQLSPLAWTLSPYVHLPMPSTRWMSLNRGLAGCSGYESQHPLTVPSLSFNHFDHDVYPFYFFYGRHRGRLMRSAMATANVTEAAVEYEAADDDAALSEMVVAGQAPMMKSAMSGSVSLDTVEEDADEEEAADGGADVAVAMRQNLSETAFFYPQLTTDAEGRVVLKFTLPESLTTWRFMGVAHTKDMRHGTIEGEAVARKDVMIQPNMPRFVRQGDHATVSARIINTSDHAISGTARLQLLVPETELVVAQADMAVSVDAGATTSVTFDCAPDDTWPSLLIARMSVSGPTFSDGEQHYLPVLPNQERVTVTAPFTQNGPGTTEIDLTKLIPQTSPLSPLAPTLTIEYTNNPAWLMVQALPTVAHPHDGCAICQAVALYSNTLGRHILAQNPQAKGVFELWRRDNSSLSPLASSLSKDEELKDLLLTETPWVMDANREAEQKQRLADFFDENLMAQRLGSAVEKLRQLQHPEGAWSWWPGMRGSFYITVEVCEMLARLNQMAGLQTETKGMLNAAFSYLGKEMTDLVAEMKRQEKKGHPQSFPSHKALQWLYICAIDGRELPASVQEANDYLKNLLRKETKNQSIYEKAMSAIVLHSVSYVQSLKEYTVYKEDMGRYYDTPRAGYSWRDYRIPTQVAAIEAMQRLTPDDTKTIEEMRRWLLQEKRTQSWNTPINSADAVYAFLGGKHSEQLSNPLTSHLSSLTSLKIDGQTLETSAATAGLGYVKATVPAQGQRTFTAEKTSSGTSWGAVYAQFMQNTSDIKEQKSGFSVKREVIPLTSHPSSLTSHPSPLTPHPSPLTSYYKVGDRVKVRITIQADRDYDFVQVVDKRAACMEPVQQLSGYGWGYYCTPRDCTTNYYFDLLAKGKHVIETEYYIDRAGTYETGTCTAQCAYSPEFRGTAKSLTITVE